MRGIFTLMMRCEGKAQAPVLNARGPMTPTQAGSSVSGSPRQRPALTFWLRTKHPSKSTTSPKALDSFVERMENKMRTCCLCQS